MPNNNDEVNTKVQIMYNRSGFLGKLGLFSLFGIFGLSSRAKALTHSESKVYFGKAENAPIFEGWRAFGWNENKTNLHYSKWHEYFPTREEMTELKKKYDRIEYWDGKGVQFQCTLNSQQLPSGWDYNASGPVRC